MSLLRTEIVRDISRSYSEDRPSGALASSSATSDQHHYIFEVAKKIELRIRSPFNPANFSYPLKTNMEQGGAHDVVEGGACRKLAIGLCFGIGYSSKGNSSSPQ